MTAGPVILGFDTSAAHCATALLMPDSQATGGQATGGQVITRLEPMEKGQAERLMPMLAEVLAGAGLAWQDLDAIAVGTGPGNFTGVRIAVAAARGLALGLGIPAIGVTRLEALAFGLPRPLLVAEDARRDEAYVQGFDISGYAAAQLLPVAALPAAPHITGSACPGGLAAAMPLAEAITRIAAARLATGTAQPRPAPFYLRSADAAPPADPPPVILP